MKQPVSRFENAVTLITDLSLFNTALLSFSLSPGAPWTLFRVGYLPWFACGLFGYFINSLFLRKSRPIPAVVGLNALLAAAEASVLYYFSSDMSGKFSYAAFACGVLLAVGRGYWLVLNPVSQKQRLVYTECSFFMALWFYFIQTGGMSYPVSYDFILFFVLSLNLAVLVRLRVSSEEGTLNLSGRWAALLIVAVAAVLALSLLLFTGFFSGGLRSLTNGAIGLVARVVETVVGALAAAVVNCLNFLLSLLPDADPGRLIPPEQILESLHLGELKEDHGIDPAAVKALSITLAAAAAAVVVALLIRFRHFRISASVGGERPGRKRKRPGRALLFRRWLRSVSAKVRFFLLSVVYRRTPAGLLLALERFGKRRKLPRRNGETIRAYVGRLVRETALSADRETPPLFARLCDELDFCYYSGSGRENCACRLSPAELSLLRRRIRKADGVRSRIAAKRKRPQGSGG